MQQRGACRTRVPQTNLAFAALCQSARTANEREGCPVLSAPGPRLFPVCGSFRFYVLMIDDETGVLRHASASLKERGNARRG
jgi:hypothetical protein